MDPIHVIAAGQGSTLCDLCQLILTMISQRLQSLDPASKLPKAGRRLSADPSIPDMLVLAKSAEDGCGFCVLVLLTLQSHLRNFASRSNDKEQMSSFQLMTNAITYYPCLHIDIHSWDCYNWDVVYRLEKVNGSEVIESLSSFGISISSLASLTREGFRDRSNQHPEPFTKSPASWDQCKTWIRQCVTSHSACNYRLLPNHNLPSRLIDVSVDPPALRLSRDLPIEAKYITLSHCWGTSRVVTLTEQNLSSFQISLPLELSKTFQDTIEVARRFLNDFNVRYVWIDSLCIIQDSVEDWLFESPRMADVYGNAFCNIAATSAQDGEGGLFFERDLLQVTPLWVRMSLAPLHRNFDALCYSSGRWKENIQEAPLNCRAWVYQEQALSPRVLHFTKNAIFWQCQHIKASETFPQGEPEPVIDGEIPQDVESLRLASMQMEQASELNPRSRWAHSVREYCRRQLSHPEDKLLGMSGIAHHFQHLFNNSQYLAGLWRFELEKQLLWTPDREVWRRDHEDKSARPRSNRPPIYRAPSWSWASLDGLITAWWHDEDEFFVKVLDAQTTTIGHNPFGQVSTGFIRIRCKLFPASIEKAADPRPEFNSQWLTLLTQPPIDTENIVYIPDIASDSDSLDKVSLKGVYCIPLKFAKRETRDFETCDGLLLEPTGEFKGQFKRLGHFTHIRLRSDPDAFESIRLWKSMGGDGVEEFEESHSNGEYTISIV